MSRAPRRARSVWLSACRAEMTRSPWRRFGCLRTSRLGRRPDLVVCDGHGRAHPRRLGLACHLGLWLDVPTIGCAKTRLVGTYRDPGLRRGCHRRLLDRGEVVGEVVRTRARLKPVFVSVGHLISRTTARRWILRLARRYRLPEPIRAAHHTVNLLRT